MVGNRQLEIFRLLMRSGSQRSIYPLSSCANKAKPMVNLLGFEKMVYRFGYNNKYRDRLSLLKCENGNEEIGSTTT